MGGAKNCPETPRQKMISMMYLVLTAMLALNVSAAILNGYAQVDDSLHATIVTMDESNRETYAQFEAALKDNQVKVGQYYNKAMEVQKASNAFYDYVQSFKDAMVVEAEGKKAKSGARVRELGKQDDTNVPQRYAINEGNAAILKEKINAYRDFMIDITGNSPALDHELRETFVTPRGVNAEGDSISWEDAMFHEMPMCACITVLTKLQSDIRHCEGRAVRYLLTASDASDVRVNKFDAYVIPNSDYVVKGNTYRAQIILAAIDSTRTPQYYVNGRQIQSNGIFEMVANTVGQQRISGEIAYMDNQGVMKRVPFMREFTVGEPSATVSNTDLNIMYRGYDNPFSISVPGVSSNQLDVRCKQASIKKKDNTWIIKPNANSADMLAIEVYAKINNRDVLMGSHKFRVKPLPRPDAYFEINGEVTDESKIALRHLVNPKNRIVASYGPDGLIQAKFDIVGFQVKLQTGASLSVQGDHFDTKVLNAIKKLKQGNTINIMYIKAKGPDGKEVQLRGLPIELN
jgi:gliding motility-associated protein GldM